MQDLSLDVQMNWFYHLGFSTILSVTILTMSFQYSNLGRSAHTLMMYTTMVFQAWSDYTFWRESRITRQLFSNFTLAWTPFWAPGFGVLCHIGSQALSYSGRLVPISLSCRLTRATRTQCHIVQQLYGRIRQILRSIKETKSIKINSLSAPSWNCLVVWSLSDVTARHSLPPKDIRSTGCWTRSSSFPQLQVLPLSWLHFYEGIIAKNTGSESLSLRDSLFRAWENLI